jgi:hypothetical protein
VFDDGLTRTHMPKTLVPWAQRRTDRSPGVVMGLRRYRTSAIGLSIKDSSTWKDEKGGAIRPERHKKRKKALLVPVLTSLPFHKLGPRCGPSNDMPWSQQQTERNGSGSGDADVDVDVDVEDVVRKRRSAFESFRTRGNMFPGAGALPLGITPWTTRPLGLPSTSVSVPSQGPLSLETMTSTLSATGVIPPTRTTTDGVSSTVVVGAVPMMEHSSGMEHSWKWKVDSLPKSHEKEIVCVHCGTPFTSQTNLRRHMKIHSGFKPFACTHPGCNQEFLRRCDLKTHMRTHTKERPYVCSFEGCDRTFTTCSNLRRHERTGHGNEK